MKTLSKTDMKPLKHRLNVFDYLGNLSQNQVENDQVLVLKRKDKIIIQNPVERKKRIDHLSASYAFRCILTLNQIRALFDTKFYKKSKA